MTEATREPTIMEALQDDLRTWHNGKYPFATMSDIGLKLAEESGEVCRALDRMHYAKSDEEMAAWSENLEQEIGDAAIVLLVLCNRRGWDFESLVTSRAQDLFDRDNRLENHD